MTSCRLQIEVSLQMQLTIAIESKLRIHTSIEATNYRRRAKLNQTANKILLPHFLNF